MSEKQIAAIEAALKKGLRVELTPNRDGTVTVRTVVRQTLKP